MKYKVIIIIGILILLFVGVLSLNKTNKVDKVNLDAEGYKQLLIQLGYSEDDMFDKTFEEGNIKRWLGIVEKDVYACFFEMDSESAAKAKVEEAKKAHPSEEVFYTKFIDNNVIIIFTTEEDENKIVEAKEKANKIIEAIEKI